MASSSSSPCAACKFLRRKCTSECAFAPYFPPDQPQKFANVHKIFGASNVSKLLHELSPPQREDAVNSLAYEADARVRDPVYGCVGAISLLQRQITKLQQELAVAHQDLVRYAASNNSATSSSILQQTSASPQRVGTGVPRVGPGISREQSFAREQLMEVKREQQLSREQVLEIARIGGGSYEAGLAALGLTVSFGPLGTSFVSRQSRSSSGDGGSGTRHLPSS